MSVVIDVAISQPRSCDAQQTSMEKGKKKKARNEEKLTPITRLEHWHGIDPVHTCMPKYIRQVASTGPTDKLSVGMDHHRLAHPRRHGDAAPMTRRGGGKPGPMHRLEIFSWLLPCACIYIYPPVRT